MGWGFDNLMQFKRIELQSNIKLSLAQYSPSLFSTLNNVVEVTALKYNDEEENDFDFSDKLEPITDVINVSEDETVEDDNTKLPCGTRRPSWCGSWTPSTKMLLH